MKVQTDLIKALEALFNSEDNTGCDGDLTVVSAKAVKKLESLYKKLLERVVK